VGGVGAILIEAEGGRRMAGSIIRLLWSNNGKGGGGEATGQGAPGRPLGLMLRTTTESIALHGKSSETFQ
jgi:hypothetical protein